MKEDKTRRDFKSRGNESSFDSKSKRPKSCKILFLMLEAMEETLRPFLCDLKRLSARGEASLVKRWGTGWFGAEGWGRRFSMGCVEGKGRSA